MDRYQTEKKMKSVCEH